MKKQTIITAMLALVALAGQGQVNNTAIPEGIADTYWRNEKTGDWEIGFADSCAVYDSKLWSYSNVKEKGNKLFLTLDNGNRTVSVTIGKQKDGKCQMTIGKKKQKYSNITNHFLPLYPEPDNTPFKDNGFREGDSATIIGWMKDNPELTEKGMRVEVEYPSFLINEWKKIEVRTDKNGYFSVTIPVENTQTVLLSTLEDFIDLRIEPGDTCFVLSDSRKEKILFMGRNIRVQNEMYTGSFQVEFSNISPYDTDLTDEQMQASINKVKRVYRTNEAKLDSALAKNPTLSRKFEDVIRMINISRMANDLLQVDQNAHFKIPQAEIDSMLTEMKRNARRPYSIWYEFGLFPGCYMQHEIFTNPLMRSSTHIDEDYILQLEKDGWLTLSDEDWQLLESKDVEYLSTLLKRKDVNDAMNEKHMSEDIKKEFRLADSIFTDPILRESAKTNRIRQQLAMTEQPLNKYYLEAANMILLPAARNKILAKNQEIIDMMNKPMDLSGLRPSTDVANMNDGEKILRKILEPYKGKLILMDIWGTWCGPCKAALSDSQEEYERLKDYDLVYLYLANGSPEDSWKYVIKKYNVTGDNVVHYNLPAEQQKAIEKYLSVHSFPTYKLINRDGTILDVNADPRDLEGLARLLEQMK